MAYAKRGKAPARRSTAKSGSGGQYRKGTGGSGYRNKPAAGGRASGGKASGLHTVRIVIEQPGHSATARPDATPVNGAKARKSPF